MVCCCYGKYSFYFQFLIQFFHGSSGALSFITSDSDNYFYQSAQSRSFEPIAETDKDYNDALLWMQTFKNYYSVPVGLTVEMGFTKRKSLTYGGIPFEYRESLTYEYVYGLFYNRYQDSYYHRFIDLAFNQYKNDIQLAIDAYNNNRSFT